MATTGQGFLGCNMFAYCCNNPVTREDPDGEAFDTVFDILSLGASIADVISNPRDPWAWAGLAGDVIDVAVPFVTGVGEVTRAAKVAKETAEAVDDAHDAMKAVSNMGDMLPSAGTLPSARTLPACFIAGTLISVEDGYKAIEDVEAGDYVWAWDEETGEVALKQVVETYVRASNELIHIFVNGEEIITTPDHPFYVPVKGWTDAVNLRAGDILVLVNGEYVIVEKVQHEILEAPVTVYNFQVEDFHTYFVASSAVLVHNSSCGITPPLYHYTTAEGAESIMKSGAILPDNRGRVFVTMDKIPTADVNNALFMGTKPNSGTHVVEIYLMDPNDFRLVTTGTTQPNELIYRGALRNGKNAMLVVKENPFNG